MLENKGENFLEFTVKLESDMEKMEKDWQIRVEKEREVLEVKYYRCGTRSGGLV